MKRARTARKRKPARKNDDLQKSKIRAAIIERLNSYDTKALASLLEFMDSLERGESAGKEKPEDWQPAESYAARSNASEDIIAFIERLYGDRLDGNFTRADLRQRDQGAYVALSNWLRTHELPSHLKLPTVKERNARLIREGRIEQLREQSTLTNEEMKELRNLESIRSKMQRRETSSPLE